MALTYGFYNSVEGDRTYDAIQMSQIFDGIITDGVYATFMKGMVVKASENASEVIVQPGRCWFNHTWTYIDAEYPVEAPTPEVILDRVDALVLDINSENAYRENKLTWVQGEPASLNPARPTLTNTVTHHQYALCYVYRKAGTTMIYTADITNVIGTSETPFVTGVLEGIDLDAWINQWDDEFHTWENNTKSSFEGWMLTQESVYTSWYNAFKDQMEGDLTDFEDWFQTIQGIIDSEAATHLQSEIDDLKDMLPAGSHITITTNESTLYLRNVTVTDTASHSKTVEFNSSGEAVVDSFPYVGLLTVTSTDGERIATNTLNTPYFGRYTVSLAFWSATVNITGDEYGTVTVKNSEDTFVSSVTLDSSGHGIFYATYPDTYKFSMISGGQTMEVSLAVTQETTYNVEIHAGFNFRAWLTAGRVSGSFNTLDEVLASEPTLRQLMLVHDSVDYLAAANVNEDVTKIFNTDLAAKWINLSDYALDSFYAVSAIKTIMDTADKYGYGEWALVGQVPKMTSNTVPYGEASASSVFHGEDPAYYAFDNNESTSWLSNDVATNQWVMYKFTEAKCIKRVFLKHLYWTGQSPTYAIKNFRIEASNNGTNFTTLYTGVNSNRPQTEYIDLNNNTSYTYYRVFIVDSYGGSYVGLTTVQFYAWAPKGNVPVMTSNTAPYGTAFSNNESQGPTWCAFDDNANTVWMPVYSSGSYVNYIGYKFVNPVNVRKVKVTFVANYSASSIHYKIQGSNDGTTWIDVSGEQTFSITAGTPVTNYVNCNNNAYYLQYRLLSDALYVSGVYAIGVGVLQFYGRELSVSVPVMTSDTAPYGVAVDSSTAPNYAPYKAFDGNDTTLWAANTSASGIIGYDFGNPVRVKKAYRKGLYYSTNILTDPWRIRLVYSDNGTSWQNVTEYQTLTMDNAWIENTEIIAHRYWGVEISSAGIATSTWNTYTVQFYGSDYSEKEFESGTTKKWLYDHGVEPDGTLSTSGTVTKDAYAITLGAANTQVSKSVTVTNYSVYRGKVGLNASGTTQLICGSSNSNFTSTNMPNNNGYSISSVTGSNVTGVKMTAAGTCDVVEFWLE